eukprot:CAMPEP_0114493742 /NCGR_PEP_ID=MMETSP0109-20121206/4269_1 /TAXON_ID=29199 /ORGANISM="Chlorarachnion reptans, Strain CCCM449" /LENGTH=121 /DNA_ID=CAMNT_0001670709 /DNA_START=93 /DNA_END=458 /DNA_ORIENTATION=+
MLRSAINRFAPSIRRAAAPVRRMGTGSQYIPPTDQKKVWLSDAGAYPIMIIIGCAATLGTFALARMTTKAPQLTWDKERRSMQISEGSHEEAVHAENYFDHPVRRFGKRRYQELLTHKKPE